MRYCTKAALFAAVISPIAHAGWFGPDNFDDCVLSKMKGQNKSMIHSAKRACEQEFPHVRRLYEFENSTIMSWGLPEDENGLTGSIALAVSLPDKRYRVVRVFASFSEKPCNVAHPNDFNISVAFEFKPGESSATAAINPFQKPACMSGNKQIFGILNK